MADIHPEAFVHLQQQMQSYSEPMLDRTFRFDSWPDRVNIEAAIEQFLQQTASKGKSDELDNGQQLGHQLFDQDGNSILHKSIIYGQYELARYIIENHTQLINLKNIHGIYPIHLCVIKGNMPMLRLISRESKKHINKRDSRGFTPAMYAAVEGKYEQIKYLLDNANAKYNKLTKKEKYTLLHLAVQSGSLDTVQYLIMKMGMSYLKCRTKEGATVYHIAAARGHDQILDYLLAIKSAKCFKHIKDITGSTPAHDAAENGN
jgi:ankyrin repeat protein